MTQLFPDAENNPYREDGIVFLKSVEQGPPTQDFSSWLPPHPVPVHTYHVPKKFGMSGMLAIMTLTAIVFGLLRNFPGGLNFSERPDPETHPVAYIFLGVLVLTTCVAQMMYGDVPRAASCIAGAILLPLCILCSATYYRGLDGFAMFLCGTPFLAIGGALCGYLAGGCTAGCFLLMDKFDHWYMQHVLKRPTIAQVDEPILAELVEPKMKDDAHVR